MQQHSYVFGATTLLPLTLMPRLACSMQCAADEQINGAQVLLAVLPAYRSMCCPLQKSVLEKVSDYTLAFAIPVHLHMTTNAVVTDYVPSAIRGEPLAGGRRRQACCVLHCRESHAVVRRSLFSGLLCNRNADRCCCACLCACLLTAHSYAAGEAGARVNACNVLESCDRVHSTWR